MSRLDPYMPARYWEAMSPESSHILFRHLLVFLAAIFYGGSGRQRSPASGSTQNEANIRFASLRADEVNVRAGPGVRYHVKWVFVRKHLPVMITAEFESWRKIRDSEGAEGWVHRGMLSGRAQRRYRRRGHDIAPHAKRDSTRRRPPGAGYCR